MSREMEIDSSAFDDLLRQAAVDASKPIEAVIRVNDPKAAKYWGVLEHGSTPGQRPWPQPRQRTTYGIGEDAGRVVSKQARGGFAFRFFKKFLDFLGNAAMRRMSGSPLTRDQMKDSVNETGEFALRVIKAGAPVDSGRLRDSIVLEKAK